MIKQITYYYKSKVAEVRDADMKDVFALAPNVREADKREIWKSHHRTPEGALMSGYTSSVFCLTIIYKGKPIAMFGVSPESLLSDKAIVWLLASQELEKVQKTFIRNNKRIIAMFLAHYPTLYNFVDVENKQSIKWLMWCGAHIGTAVPYGIEQKLFNYFEFRREDYV